MVNAGWSSVPHLDEKAKRELLASTPPYLRDARSKGTPSLGAGAIYPIPISEIEVGPFAPPMYWKRAYGLDVGWNRTAAIWGAKDPNDNVLYLYAEYYRSHAEPSSHATAIKARGKWIRGVIDSAARGRSQKDGEQLLYLYQQNELKLLSTPSKVVEAGLVTVWQMLEAGRLKIFSTLHNFKAEYMLYRRDEKGNIVKANDHLMDCLSGDTLVCTDTGKRRLRDLVGTKGNVLTVGGVYAPYRDCKMYGRARRVVRLVFNDGTSVVCTPDHRFLSRGCWVPALEMEGKDCDTAISTSIGAQSWSSSSLNQSRNSTENAIIAAASISREAGDGSISRYGKTLMARFRQATTFTIATMIERTISLRIFNSKKRGSIFRIINEVIDGHYRKPPWKPRHCGTEATRGARGIASTMKELLGACTSMPIWIAPTAANALAGASTGLHGSARITARQKRERHLALMTNRGAVSIAAAHSQSTNTPALKHAAENAQLRCVSVKDADVEDVYCITVPSTAAFAIENGLITHNCMRYLVTFWDEVATVMPMDSIKRPGIIIGDRKAGL